MLYKRKSQIWHYSAILCICISQYKESDLFTEAKLNKYVVFKVIDTRLCLLKVTKIFLFISLLTDISNISSLINYLVINYIIIRTAFPLSTVDMVLPFVKHNSNTVNLLGSWKYLPA